METELLQVLLHERFKPEICEMTIKDYLKELLTTLWKEEESFSGQRPFGNGGWQWDLYGFLLSQGLIPGELDNNGGILDVDEEAGEKLVLSLIQAM